jgi:hypothetical protein
MGWIVFLLLVGGCVAYGVWSTTTENGKAYATKLSAQTADKKAQKLSSQLGKGGRVNAAISQVGAAGAAGLACPRCGGTAFKAKRSAGGKVAGGLLAPKTRVKCITCATEYRRG